MRYIHLSSLKMNVATDAVAKTKGHMSNKDIFFNRQRAVSTIGLSKICGTLRLYQNVMGPGVNNSH